MTFVQSGMKKSVWRIVGDLKARLKVTRNAWSVAGLKTMPAFGLHCASYCSGLS